MNKFNFEFFINKKFIKYIINGLVINVTSFAIYILFTSAYFSFDPILVIMFLYPVVVFFNFLAQNYLIFKKKFKLSKFFNFITFQIIIYFSNILLLYILVNIMEINHIISQLFILIFLTLINFIITKKIVE